MHAIHGGVVKRLVPLTETPFPNLIAGARETIQLASHIDTLGFSQVDVLFRIHKSSSIGAGASLTFTVAADGAAYWDSTSAFQLDLGPGASLVADSTAPIPFFGIVSSAGGAFSGFGRYLLINLTASQPAGGAVALSAMISVDLVLKGGDPATLHESPNVFRGIVIR